MGVIDDKSSYDMDTEDNRIANASSEDFSGSDFENLPISKKKKEKMDANESVCAGDGSEHFTEIPKL